MNIKRLTFLLLMPLFLSCEQISQQSDFNRLGLEEITVDELKQGYMNGDFTIQDVTAAYLARIDEIDKNGPALNSILSINPDAMGIAAVLDRELQEGLSRGRLHGIPIVLKDNIDTTDMPTTAGSRFLEGSVPTSDAHIVELLREKGAIVLGKANLSEWANFHSSFSSSGWSSLGGQVKNPYELSRNPCGSSAGSGSAVSANLATLAIGTETNGSIVCPSGANGVVGFKPTIGLWSRSGIIPISYTTDSAGPMVRTVRDAAILLGELAGVDERDEKTAEAVGHIHSDYTQYLNEDGINGKRIGFYTSPMGNFFRVDTLMLQTVKLFEELGAEIVEIDQIAERNIGSDAFQVLLFEFKDGLNSYFESLGEDTPVRSIEHLVELTNEYNDRDRFDRNLIITASEMDGLDSEAYQNALENMLTQSRDRGIDRVMDEHQLDAIISPTGSPAWKTDLTLGDNFKLSSSSPSARSGYPIITLPMGTIDGLPVGLSIFGRAWSEPILLEIAYAFEQKRGARVVPRFLE